jgi:hypothetical protein
MQKGAVQPVAMLEVSVGGRSSIALVTEHGMTDGGEMLLQLMFASALGPQLEQTMATDHLSPAIGGERSLALAPLAQ